MSSFLAVLAAVAVLLGLITAILGLVNQRRIRATASDVQTITVNVDGRLAELLTTQQALVERQDQLLGALHQADVPVPPRPALPGEVREDTASGSSPG